MKYLVYSLLLSTLISCNLDIDKPTRVSIHFDQHSGDTITLAISNQLDFSKQILAETILDSKGNGEIILDSIGTLFTTLEISGSIIPLLLQSQDDVILTSTSSNLDSIQFEGEGSLANIYLQNVSRVYQKYELWDGKLFFRLDSLSFTRRLEKIKIGIDSIEKNLFESNEVPYKIKGLLRLENEARELSEILNFELVTQKKMPYNTEIMLNSSELIQACSNYYSIATIFYLDSKIVWPLFKEYDSSKSDSVNYLLPELVWAKLNSLDANPKVLEFLMAKHLFYAYFSQGISSPPVIKMFTQWKTAFPSSNYIDDLESQLLSIIHLESGISAPEITGVSKKGDSIKLSDYKGRVVYIDVWATWCGPCIKSLPLTLDLQAKFKPTDFVTLYVSIDKDVDKWRMYLDSKQTKENHIITDGVKLRNDYKIGGIPRYILIGRDGKVIKANAHGPGDSRTVKDINELIKKSR